MKKTFLVLGIEIYFEGKDQYEVGKVKDVTANIN